MTAQTYEEKTKQEPCETLKKRAGEGNGQREGNLLSAVVPSQIPFNAMA